MSVCTSCKHNREIERLRKICAACNGASCNFGGDVHIDAAKDPSLVLRHADVDRIADARAATASRVNVADEKTADLLLRVVSEFAALTDDEAPIVARRMRGQENWQIAHEMHVSQAVVWKRWHNLKAKNPLWAAIDNGLIGKRKGGRKVEEKPKDFTQKELF